MEGVQYIRHRVIDGEYAAILHWKVESGVVYIREGVAWSPTQIELKFHKDFEYTEIAKPEESK